MRVNPPRIGYWSLALVSWLAPAWAVQADEVAVAPVEVEEQTDDAPSLNVGIGLRTGLAFSKSSGDAQVSLTDGFMGAGNLGGGEVVLRPYFSGQLNKYVGFSANFEANTNLASGTVPVRILDAVIQLQFDDAFNVWLGQFLPPQDRSALDGPFYMNAWNYPIQVAGFPFDIAARDRGVAFWGQFGGGKFKYQVGAFDLQSGVLLKNARFAARLVLNLLDPEPGYYNSSTYYGEKDIFAIGVSAAAQPSTLVDASTGDEVDAASYGLQADLLFEKRMGSAGVFTFEGSLWYFDQDGAYVVNPGGRDEGVGLDPTYDSGTSVLAVLSYLSPGKAGIGYLQPNIRLQYRAPDADGVDPTLTLDAALGYIIDGHNNKLYLGFQRIHPTGDAAVGYNAFYLGSQVQM